MNRIPRAVALLRRAVALALPAFVLAATAGPSSAAPSPLSVRVTAGAASFAASEAVTVHVAIANDGSEDVRLLAWNTPEAGPTAPLFDVTREGEAATYLGAVMKRPAPADGDYLVVAAGGRLEYDVELSRWYSFATTGDYDVAYRTASPVLFSSASGERTAGDLASIPLRIHVEGRADPLRKAPRVMAVVRSSSFVGCSGSQQTDILAARSGASTYAAGAVGYFTANRAGQRYQKWFGTYLLSRWSTVDTHYTNIRSLVDTGAMIFDCNCTDSSFAYVYPNDASHTVHLCSAFWPAPTTGTDSKAGTLIHETSHFSDIAGTDDYVYGQSGAQALATSNPAQAVMNADNHEYFAENTPATTDTGAAYTLDSYAHDFGNRLVSTTSPATVFTLTSTGGGTLNITTLAASGDFTLPTNTCNGASLAPAATCTFSVAFAPTAVGTRVGSVTIPSNAAVASSPALSGTGTVAGAACGDGNLDSGEECDDGNVYDGDGCSSTCLFEPCRAAPRSGCVDAGVAILLLSEKAPGKEKAKLTWKKLASTTTAADFGDPVAGSTSLAACLYDDGNALAHGFVIDRGSDTCDGFDCWVATGSGFAYSDPLASSDGIAKAAFSSGPALKGKASAFGANNPALGLSTLPTGIVAALSGSTQPTMQFVTSNGLCVSATMDMVLRDDGATFLAKKK